MTATQAMRLKDMYPSHHFLWNFIFHIFMGWKMHLITAKSPSSPSSILQISHFPIPFPWTKNNISSFPLLRGKESNLSPFHPLILSFFSLSFFLPILANLFRDFFLNRFLLFPFLFFSFVALFFLYFFRMEFSPSRKETN